MQASQNMQADVVGVAAYPVTSPFPWLAMMALCIGTLAHGVMFTAPLPFVAFMVVDFGMVDNVDQAGYWAGWITGFFMIGRCVVGIPWGLASDKYGRKKCMLISMTSLCIFGILFGLSTSFTMAIVVRLFIGFGNGFIGIAKTIISELCPKEHEVRGFGILNGIFGLGFIVGPMVGGLLSRPALLYPGTFSQHGLWGQYPYLLPCVVCASIACLAVVAISLWVPETLETVEPLPCFAFWWPEMSSQQSQGFELLSMHSLHGLDNVDTEAENGKPDNSCATIISASSLSNESELYRKEERDAHDVYPDEQCIHIDSLSAGKSASGPDQDQVLTAHEIIELGNGNSEDSDINNITDDPGVCATATPTSSPIILLLKDKYVMNILVVNIFYCFINMFVDEVFPLWGVSTSVEGGLAWTSAKVGGVLACIGGMLVLFQLIGYEAVVKHCCSEDCVITLFRFIMFGSVAVCLLPVLPGIIIASHRAATATAPHFNAGGGNYSANQIRADDLQFNVSAIGLPTDSVSTFSSSVDIELAVAISVITTVTLFKIATTAGFASLSILTNAAVEKEQRGTINGLVMTCGSFGNAMGPILGSAFYAVAVDAPPPIEGRMVFVVAAAIFLSLGFAAKFALAKPTRNIAAGS